MSFSNGINRQLAAFIAIIIIAGSAIALINYLNQSNSTNAPVEYNNNLSYAIVDTNQVIHYGEMHAISEPSVGDAFYGQDALYSGYQPSYQDNGDGTVTDLNTGLMWQQDPGEKMTFEQALEGADDFDLAGYTDWRLPSIKELYSLILFSGQDPSGDMGGDTSNIEPFIDTEYFDFEYGDPQNNERIIDSQYASSTVYVHQPLQDKTVFGVNFADGRIKGYGSGPMPGQPDGKLFFVMYVRGNSQYGLNDFIDNTDQTISDTATGLMWSKSDSAEAMSWEDALFWVEQKNAENYLGYDDWRLPNAKELQSIVDYSRSPDTSDSAAIDPLFDCTIISNEKGEDDYAFYWTSTTHASFMGTGSHAVYVAFGRSLGYMNGEWIDIHGAGSQRSDPKVGDPADYPEGHGPQGDAIRIFNYLRLVRNI